MKSAPSSVAMKVRTLKVPSVAASAVPTSTGATAAGSVRGRAAISQMRKGLKGDHRHPREGAIPRSRRASLRGCSRAFRELREVGLALGLVRLAAFLRLVAGVEEEVGVVRELLDAAEPVLLGVEAGLQEPEREGGELEHLPAPLHGLLLELVERHDGVDQAHVECLLSVVLAAEEPDLLRLLRADEAGEDARAVAAVEGADARAGLAEARVVGRDREVADEMQHMPAADRIARDHGHDRLGQAADLDVQVGHVE